MRTARYGPRAWTPPQVLAIGYAAAILLGGALLKLPWATERAISWSDAYFTATSAATVTGLVVVDTGSTFSPLGEMILLLLMQVGGLGLMTFAVLTALVLGRKVGLRQRIMFGDSMGTTPLGNVVSLVKTLLVFTVIMEAIGTVLLALTFVPDRGLGEGLYFSLFHSVSAFNNAGFGLLPDNLIAYAGDTVVNVVISVLLIVGGLGFTVLADLRRTRSLRLLSLHTKLMLVGTLVINVVVMLLFLVLEHGNPGTLGSLSRYDQVLTSWFQAVTPRTAGFNTIDTGAMEDSTVLLTMLLMFIGAGSASTGSGIKLTTFIVILLAAVAFLRGYGEPRAFGRTISHDTVLRALAIATISALTLFGAMFLLVAFEPAPLDTLMFEAASAFGTVGLSMGITADLSAPGRLIIMFLMFVGRIGPLSLVFILARRRQSVVSYPHADVMTG